MSLENDKLVKIARELASCLDEAMLWIEHNDDGLLLRCELAIEDFEYAKALNG